MEEKNILKQAKQKLTIQGTLKEKKLEKRVKEDGGEYISGFVTITTKSEDDVIVKLFANRYKINKQTNQKELNSLYSNLEKIINDYVSQAEIDVNGITDKTATKIYVKGASFGDNDYYNAKLGRMVEGVAIKGLAIEELTKEPVPQAEFEITAFLYKMSDEIKDDNETGRKKCTFFIPLYGGKIGLFEAVATPVISNFLESQGVKKTYKILGKIKNTYKSIETVTRGVAGDITTTTIVANREYEIDNMPLDAVIEEGQEGYLNPDSVKIALADREASLKETEEAKRAGSINSTNNVGW